VINFFKINGDEALNDDFSLKVTTMKRLMLRKIVAMKHLTQLTIVVMKRSTLHRSQHYTTPCRNCHKTASDFPTHMIKAKTTRFFGYATEITEI
jgi:hypothetical protein